MNQHDPRLSLHEWLRIHANADPYASRELRHEALQVIKAAVESGELTSIDGVASPLSLRILGHHGAKTFEMNSNWTRTSQDWKCPCCRRDKMEISRKGNLGQVLAKLVSHHDHMGDAMKAAFHEAFRSAGTVAPQVDGFKLVERMASAFSAYDEVLVCEDCNNADTSANRLIGEPKHFSFSVGQLKQFIDVTPHQPHELRADQVQVAWAVARSAYQLRMRLIGEVAHAAATDAHWFEPSEGAARRVPLLGTRSSVEDRELLRWAGWHEIATELGRNTQVSKPNLARWRTEVQRRGASIPENFLPMLCSEPVQAQLWAEVPESWRCPICLRSKQSTVYVGENGKVLFRLNSGRRSGTWAVAPRICNHCNSTLMSLKREVADLLGSDLENSYSFVTPTELSRIITARPHSSHAIKGREAEELVREIVARRRGLVAESPR